MDEIDAVWSEPRVPDRVGRKRPQPRRRGIRDGVEFDIEVLEQPTDVARRPGAGLQQWRRIERYAN